MDSEGNITPQQLTLLEQSQMKEVEELFERAMQADPVFAAYIRACDKAAEFQLDLFYADLAADTAKHAALGLTESQWLLESTELPGILADDNILPSEAAAELYAAKLLLLEFDLWPWGKGVANLGASGG